MTNDPGAAGGTVSTTYYRRRRPRLSTLAMTVRTVAVAAVLSTLIAAGLALQMARGGDPALGESATPEAGAARTRVVQSTVVRRVAEADDGSNAVEVQPPASPAPPPAPVTSATS